MNKKSFYLFILCLILVVCHSANARTIRLCKDKNLQKQLTYPNAIYVVKGHFDLNGEKLQLPKGCTLKFTKGSFMNGEVEGDSSLVVSGKQMILKDVNLTGSWKNKLVYSDWFDFSQDSLYDNRENFRNVTTLCNGKNHTDVFIRAGNYWVSTKDYEYAILIPSNTTWYCSATLREIPNSFNRAPFIKVFKSNNVEIYGGVYIGDLQNHKDENGEWSHGIECRASSNVTIKDVVCKEFWGDGIDVIDGYDDNLKPVLNCKNVVIESVQCLYNRRSGISIEAVFDCSVNNSACMYNGAKRGTGPKAGICIEPWSNANEKIKNILVEGCKLLDNVEWGVLCYANGPFRKDFVKYDNNILIKNCEIGFFFVSYTNGVTLENCAIINSKGYEFEYVKGLRYVDTTLKGKMLNEVVSHVPN